MFETAELSDLPRIVDIYNQTIASRMVTADTETVTVEERRSWFLGHTPERPIFVYKQDERVVGWLSFKSFYGRPAYDGTVEVAIYLCESVRGQGLGRKALNFVEAHAHTLAIENLLAFIFSHNKPSIGLFTSAGFSVWGQLPDVARMDGQLYSLTILGKSLVA
ncbi:N-acetyltransferase family protein [Pseudoalteromonas sp. CNC9-20]|uniref:GNAT family N-acetyltransferase n=1 Tax=Pseudoalteromonas sp. CNC9-20 TaxID=2917750 RepID=UPI001EF605AF|nr:GNAT family N-acetyltransferase [Pseudoalteromonas sp. CNC9-20]MCG7570471.1 N-acetyltransferase family protein [Pseudoalteromonas sp. CNC9-20]